MIGLPILHRVIAILHVLLLMAPAVLVLVPLQARAAPITSRLILLGDSRPSVVTTHSFSFNLITSGSVGSIEFEYCDNNPFVGSPCTAPAGLNVAGANLSSESGETGFTVDGVNTTPNRLVITRPSVVASPQTVIYTFDTITNPSTPKQTGYVRISTFATTDATGPRTDDGSVAFSTAGTLSVGGYVPPFLTMCVGITVAANCSTVSGGLVALGELSVAQPRSGTSQFGVATNDPAGFGAFVAGTTLTSGNNVIPALAPQQPSATGTSQFGINLRDNSTPNIGQDPAGVGTGAVAAGYSNPNQYRFVSGEQIAASPISTDFTVFTVSYIANISTTQTPGIYSSTMTYIAVAAF